MRLHNTQTIDLSKKLLVCGALVQSAHKCRTQVANIEPKIKNKKFIEWKQNYNSEPNLKRVCVCVSVRLP